MKIYELTYKEPQESHTTMGLFRVIEDAMSKADFEEWRQIKWTPNNSGGFVGTPIGGDYYWNIRRRKVE